MDIPEVSLVAILDADKEGFLRSATSLIQTSGRAARNISGQVVFYADTVTGSMQQAIDETARRRKVQTEYNLENNITPISIKKSIRESLGYKEAFAITSLIQEDEMDYTDSADLIKLIGKLESEMYAAAKDLEFEKAAQLRDQLKRLRDKELEIVP